MKLKDLFENFSRPNNSTPLPGESSGSPATYKNGVKPIIRMMSASQIIKEVKDVPYYNNVVDHYSNNDTSWPVTTKVLEYAHYLKANPLSIKNLPPIIVVDGRLQDGAHRISAVWLLGQRLDPKNPLWQHNILKVEFVNKTDIH